MKRHLVVYLQDIVFSCHLILCVLSKKKVLIGSVIAGPPLMPGKRHFWSMVMLAGIPEGNSSRGAINRGMGGQGREH